MCLRHWRMVPRDLQAGVWEHYRPGQERDKKPTREYVVAASRAICAVAVREGKLTGEQAARRLGWLADDEPLADRPAHKGRSE